VAPRTAGPEQPCVARQPIFDRRGQVFAYELLFRPSQSASASGVSSDDATARVIVDSLLSIGLDTLTGGKRAFINLTRETLVSGAATLLPADKVVIELLEDLQPDDEVRQACTALKKAGYSLALDDFAYSNPSAELLQFADYVKVDFLEHSTAEARSALRARLGTTCAQLVAEKIETTEQSAEAAAEGFSYFQGYFFGRPAVRQVKRIAASKLAYATLLTKLIDPNIHLSELEAIIKQDASLSYRVLRAVNSAATSLQVEIGSIRQAIILLGRDTIRRWASLWAMASLNETANPELAVSSIIRAHCCEQLGSAGTSSAGSAFLLGLCSMLDAILEQPMEAAIAPLPLEADIRAALLGEQNERRALLDCVIAYERGEWGRHEELARRARVNASLLPAAYREALKWTRDFTQTPRQRVASHRR
jgi:c-di-GMP-related signal transduction protein